MEMIRQKTVCTAASVQGVTLHSGSQVKVTVRPAPVNTGVVFNRIDVDRAAPIEATASNVVDTSRATTLSADGELKIGTVEHLLSALRGLGVDNVFVDLNGDELPALDGSSAPYVDLIRRAGVQTQRSYKRLAVLNKTVEVRSNGSYARLTPAPRFLIDCTIDFDHPIIGEQRLQIDFSQTSYESEIANARTFAFFHEVQWLRSQGLAKGGSLDNCIVVDGEKILNDDGLRKNDEFVRHKVLDAVGDLALLGMPIIGKLTCYKTGHAVHLKLLQTLLDDPSSFDVLVPHQQEALTSLGLHLPEWAPARSPLAA